MATAGNTSLIGKLLSTAKAYHAKHPVATGYVILLACSSTWLTHKLLTNTDDLLWVSKYKRTYIVMRSDDPRVTMIKHTAGMDY